MTLCMTGMLDLMWSLVNTDCVQPVGHGPVDDDEAFLDHRADVRRGPHAHHRRI